MCCVGVGCEVSGCTVLGCVVRSLGVLCCWGVL